MSRDIVFKTDELVFSYRVGGVLRRGDKMLLQKPKNDDYAIIGGHVQALETAEDALRREYREELHVDIKVGRLIAVGEVFFPWGNRPCHQICFYYEVRLADETALPEETFHGFDELGDERTGLDYTWVPSDALRGGLKVYPLELIPMLLRDSGQTEHFVYREE